MITVNFNPTSYTVDEGESTGVDVVLSNPSTSNVTVEVVTEVGTADGEWNRQILSLCAHVQCRIVK